MITINDSYIVHPSDISAIRIDDRGRGYVYVHVRNIGELQVKREYGEGVYECADRIQQAVEEGMTQ